jgi:hypothetical protein
MAKNDRGITQTREHQTKIYSIESDILFSQANGSKKLEEDQNYATNSEVIQLPLQCDLLKDVDVDWMTTILFHIKLLFCGLRSQQPCSQVRFQCWLVRIKGQPLLLKDTTDDGYKVFPDVVSSRSSHSQMWF